MKRFTVKCAFCGHRAIRDSLDSVFPDKDIPPENIAVIHGDLNRPFSFICSCNNYTIYGRNPPEVELLSKKYKLK